MDQPSNFADVGAKSVEEKVAKRVCRFLRAWCLEYFPDPTKANGFNGTNAGKPLGLSQAYMSELGRLHPRMKPGLNVVLRLMEQTGASFEEVTGYKRPLEPQRPFTVLSHDAHIAESAADEALSRRDADTTSSTWRTPDGKRPPRKR